MNNIQNMDQTAGNGWSNPPIPMLHEVISVDPLQGIHYSYTNSMFDDLERQMRAGDAEFQESINLLRERYIFNNATAVEYFVRAHRMVVPLLIEAATQLAQAFGNKIPLALDIVSQDETSHSIYALAIWNQEVAKARAALQAFDQSWLVGNLQAINGRIVFDYELT